ncbi:MAG: hypothetical protein KDC33_05655 [Thermoleophilia bacterium]|nr:hypothetical protein [Thermoleophilia bacterium]
MIGLVLEHLLRRLFASPSPTAAAALAAHGDVADGRIAERSSWREAVGIGVAVRSLIRDLHPNRLNVFGVYRLVEGILAIDALQPV